MTVKVGAFLPASLIPRILVNVTTRSPAAELDSPEPLSVLHWPLFQGLVFKRPWTGLVATSTPTISVVISPSLLRTKEEITSWQVAMDVEKAIPRSVGIFL